jgi:23S rRNA (adenine2503-C2)-methyltransferase
LFSQRTESGFATGSIVPDPGLPGPPNLSDLSLEEIGAFIASLGKEKYRARQIMKWLYQRRAASFAEMTNLAKDFRLKLAGLARVALPAIETVRTSVDSTRKILFRLEDGLFIESVLIPGKNHWTVCISTQAGCAMGCRFCLTGREGLKRNLLPSELTGQIIQLQRHLPEGPDIRNIVLMGMGEPLANYPNVLKAIQIITSDCGMGFSNRKVTLSTCGITPMIRQLGRDICINLAISLNAPDNEKRSELMPVNRKYPLDALLDACRDYPMPGRRMLTFEYILMADVNDSPADAQNVARLLRDIRCKLNLIAFNEYPGSPFKTPPPERMKAFQSMLMRHNFTAIIRTSKGSDILAACGQLSGRKTNAQGDAAP